MRDGGVRNYSAELRREGIGIRDSYESMALGDTRYNCSLPANGVGDALSSSEMAPFA